MSSPTTEDDVANPAVVLFTETTAVPSIPEAAFTVAVRVPSLAMDAPSSVMESTVTTAEDAMLNTASLITTSTSSEMVPMTVRSFPDAAALAIVVRTILPSSFS